MVNLPALLSQAAALGGFVALVALGETLVERSGRLNLGLEGMIYLAYGVAGAVSPLTGSLPAAAAAASAASLLLALVFYLLVERLGLDQVVAGLALVFIGYGLGDIAGSWAGGSYGPTLGPTASLAVELAGLALLPLLLYLLLYRSWLGYMLRSVGEDEKAARFYGIKIGTVRLAALTAESALVGVAATYLLSIYGGGWKAGYAEGWGWLSLAVVILGYWHPIGVAAASFLLGLLYSLHPVLPVYGVPPQVAKTLPYLAVVLALAVASRLYRRLGVTPPALIWRE